MKITPNSLTVAQLLGSTNEQYVIPAYQRRYSWKKKQIAALWDDIYQIGDSDTHLLGSIVCLCGNHKAGINELELVDGQQRLTTICMLLHCIQQRLEKEGESQEAGNLSRLLSTKAMGGEPQFKLRLDSLDASEFELHASGKTEGIVFKNSAMEESFGLAREWVDETALLELGQFLYRLINQSVVIRLDVSESKDAFKLFETINDRGLRLSKTDIVKNFVLGNASRLGDDHLKLARQKWAELVANLDGVNSENFFRHFLCVKHCRRITISYVVETFKELFMVRVEEAEELPDHEWYVAEDEWEEDEDEEIEDELAEDEDEVEDDEESSGERVSFEVFMNDLVDHSKTFGELIWCETGDAAIDRHLRNLRMINSTQTYGFLMHLLVGGCDRNELLEILKLTEAFMLRRHICKERANVNETAFAKLCSVDCANAIPSVKAVYREHSPSDTKFQNAFETFRFQAGQIDRARYCLEQFEMVLHGTHQELLIGGTDLVHVEHIIPRKIKSKKAIEQNGDWIKYLGNNAADQHVRYVDRLGNLTLFAGVLNIQASNNPYEKKCPAFKESGLKLTNSLPVDYPEFRFEQVEVRSQLLAGKALELWPIPNVD